MSYRDWAQRKRISETLYACMDCNAVIDHSNPETGRRGVGLPPQRCEPCRAKWNFFRVKDSGRAEATSWLHKAIRRGEILPATNYDCVDCGGKATSYDHRDYTYPLQVEPVCWRCNTKRGSAKPARVGRAVVRAVAEWPF